MKPIFRSSMFGFNKEDVANFIAQQSKVQEQKLRESSEQNDVLSKECDHIRAELEDAREEIASLKEKYEVKSEKLASLRAASLELEQENELFSKALQEEVAIVDQLGKDMEQLHDQLRVAEGYREKAQKFDRLAGVLSEIVSGKADERSVSEEETLPEGSIVYSAGAQLALERIEKQKQSAHRLIACYEKILQIANELDLEA